MNNHAQPAVAGPGVSFGAVRLPGAVVMGAGQRHGVGPLVGRLARTVLVCTDARLSATPEFQEILRSLERADVRALLFDRTEPELPVPGILECLESVAGEEIDAVIGLGGGSCIDMAKVVAVLLAHGGHPRDYYGEFNVPGPILPIVAIPTTAGTGSEATPVAVLMDPERTMKVGISSPELIPAVAICDPELTLSAPQSLTSAAGADALSHLVESFTAIRRSPEDVAAERVFVGKSDLTDAVARTGLSLLGRSLATAYRHPADLHARGEVMAAAFAGGVALGTAGTAAAHALQYPVGAITHTPHGVGVGTLLPYVMRFNLPERVEEFAQIADALGVDGSDADVQARAVRGVEAVDRLLDEIAIPSSLGALGITDAHVEDVVEQAATAVRLVENNPRRLDADAMRSIVQTALRGDRSMPSL